MAIPKQITCNLGPSPKLGRVQSVNPLGNFCLFMPRAHSNIELSLHFMHLIYTLTRHAYLYTSSAVSPSLSHLLPTHLSFFLSLKSKKERKQRSHGSEVKSWTRIDLHYRRHRRRSDSCRCSGEISIRICGCYSSRCCSY